jgi:TetR/AcrR family transcriptional repressor of mexJK operon
MNRQTRERRILAAALKVFSRSGYSGASMEAVAAEARLSKPTLYQYFAGKEQLFASVMAQKRDKMLQAFRMPDPGDMVEQLHRFAWAYADTVMHPDMLALARLTIGEVQRFPDLGRAYQAAGPDRLLEGLMDQMSTHREAGRLVFEDAELAAQDFWGLILSAPRTQVLYSPDLTLSHSTVARYVSNGLRVFFRAYSVDPAADLATLDGLTRPAKPQVTS